MKSFNPSARISRLPIIAWLFVFIISNGCSVDNSIDREIAGIKLGDPLIEVEKIFRLEAEEDALLALLKNYGGPVERKETIARLLEEEEKFARLVNRQSFELKGELPRGAKSIHAVFVNGSIYHIEVYYKGNYMPWTEFTQAAINRFGEPIKNQREGEESYSWSDKFTRLEISHTTTSQEGSDRKTESYAVHLGDVGLDNALARMEREIRSNKPVAPFDSGDKEGGLKGIAKLFTSLYFLPGDYTIYTLISKKNKFAESAGLRTGDYGGTLSFFLSAAMWLIGWGLVIMIVEAIKDFRYVWFKKDEGPT